MSYTAIAKPHQPSLTRSLLENRHPTKALPTLTKYVQYIPLKNEDICCFKYYTIARLSTKNSGVVKVNIVTK